jgi:replicative DNA helicase
MQGSKIARSQSKNIEIGEITRMLKKTAMDLNVPIIACCQLNREVEKRTDKKPTLADLRDSGSIEQDADIVCFIHRPEVYGIDITEEGETTDSLALLVVGKFRNGGVGDLKLKFNKETTSFTEWG